MTQPYNRLSARHATLWTGAAACLAFAFAFALAGPQQVKATNGLSCAGVSLPATDQAFGVDLVLNGMGLRTVTVFNIQAWVGGLYVERRTANPNDVLQPNRTKLMVMTLLRDTTRERMIDTIRAATDTLPAETKNSIQKNLPDLERRLPDPRKGRRLLFAYGQGQLEMRYNGKVVGRWNEPAFATAMFSAWLGAKPVDSDLKKGLLGGACE